MAEAIAKRWGKPQPQENENSTQNEFGTLVGDYYY